jgi:hypothetical protein
MRNRSRAVQLVITETPVATGDVDNGHRLGFILCGSVIYRAWTFFYEKTLL